MEAYIWACPLVITAATAELVTITNKPLPHGHVLAAYVPETSASRHSSLSALSPTMSNGSKSSFGAVPSTPTVSR